MSSSSTTDLKSSPPSFLMEAADLATDLFTPAPDPDMSPNGLLRKAPVQGGEWMLHPVYARGIAYTYDILTNTIWTRTNTVATPNGNWGHTHLSRGIEKIPAFFHKDIRWLHCFRVVTSLTDYTKYATVVVDFMDGNSLHSARRSILQNACAIPQLGLCERPVHGGFYLIPEFPESSGADIWAAMLTMNHVWGQKYYTGIMAKAADAPYAVQKFDHTRPSLYWHLHSFEAEFDKTYIPPAGPTILP